MSTSRRESNEILAATSVFSDTGSSTALRSLLRDRTGRTESKMAASKTESTCTYKMETDTKEIINAKYMFSKLPSSMNNRPTLSDVTRHQVSLSRSAKLEVVVSPE